MKPLWLVLLLLLSGCTLQQKSADNDIETLRQQHRFVSALAKLDAQQQKIADYAQRRAALLAEAQQYQLQLQREVDECARQKQFAQGHALLEQALPELPESKELTQFTQQFYGSRDRYVQRTLDELYQLRAPQLLREQILYQALQNAGGNAEVAQLVERRREETDYFARQLAVAGTVALAQKDYAKAQQYLSVANQLTPSPMLAQQLGRAEQALSATRQKTKAVRSAEREQRYRELSANIQHSLQQRDYLAARQQLDQARALAIHIDDTELYQRQLDAAISSFVAQQVEEGNRRYVNGHIEEALQIWRQADTLAPSQDLKERIEKAQRFMERYQQLQRQPVAESKATTR